MKKYIKKYSGPLLATAIVAGGVVSASVTELPALPTVTAGDVILSADINALALSLQILDDRTDGDTPVDGVDIVNKEYLDTAVAAAGDWQKNNICADNELSQGYNADGTIKCRSITDLGIDGSSSGLINFNGAEYGTIQSSLTGVVWLDRNLGAKRKCLSKIDELCYGDLYQWGRARDGHAARNATTTVTVSSTIIPGDDKFIVSSPDDMEDWSTVDNNGSQRSTFLSLTDETGICPIGFRVPTEGELTAENLTKDTVAFSQLAIPLAGFRNNGNGSLDLQGTHADIWSSTASGTTRARDLYIDSSSATWYGSVRQGGLSVRCRED